MIQLNNDSLTFSFPDVHKDAKFTINFMRTLRIPDDGSAYPLPPGLGKFPMRHIDDFEGNVPNEWVERGGVMLPMYQSEAMWLNFDSDYLMDHETEYPFAVKIATGKIDAVSGKSWRDGLHRKPHDYMISTEQPWLDGYCVEKGYIRQFVAMPLGAGYTAEEQITGKAEFGGVQIQVYPMKKEAFNRRFPKVKAKRERYGERCMEMAPMPCCAPSMGLAPGGRMRQEIYSDPFDLNDWDLKATSRCFVHLANSMVWRAITGEVPPTVPFTSKEYTNAGLPWFDYYDDQAVALNGSDILGKLKSVFQMGNQKGEKPLPENESVKPEVVIKLKDAKDQVREWKD